MNGRDAVPMVIVAGVAAFALALGESDGEAPRRAVASALPPPGLVATASADAAPAPRSYAPGESLSPNETLVPPPEAAAPDEALVPPPAAIAPKAAAPAAPRRSEPARRAAAPERQRIEVETRRADRDRRTKLAVMEAISRAPNLSGRIGVEARGPVIRLSGWTATPGQALRAEKVAARVPGVRRVVNEIRPRVGPITS